MPNLQVNIKDNTLWGSNLNVTNNIVFVPGTAITGPAEEPTLVQSIAEFTTLFGASPPLGTMQTNSTAYEYAYNMLSNGLSVLFYRVTKTIVGTTITELTTQAKADIKSSYNPTDVATATTTGTITSVYGGTFGNQMNFSFIKTSTAIVLEVYAGVKPLEYETICSITDTDTQATINAKVLAALKIMTFNTVVIDITDDVNFTCDTDYTKNIPLLGGLDADETQVLTQIPRVYDGLTDVYTYNVKFLTSGGYVDADSANTPIATAMIAVAEARQDCLAILDIPLGLPKEEVASYWQSINTSYAAAFAPWGYCKLHSGLNKWVPPSYVFLTTLGTSLAKGNTIYNAPAGSKRGKANNVIRTEYAVGGALMADWQNNNPQCVNPIMLPNIQDSGYLIYGDKTLLHAPQGMVTDTSAQQEVGVMIVMNEIVKILGLVTFNLTFEQNIASTWLAFETNVSTYLEPIKVAGGITDFDVRMNDTTSTDEDKKQNIVRGIVRVVIARAASDFVVDFQVDPAGTTYTVAQGDQSLASRITSGNYINNF